MGVKILGWVYVAAAARFLAALSTIAGTIRRVMKPRRLGDMSIVEPMSVRGRLVLIFTSCLNMYITITVILVYNVDFSLSASIIYTIYALRVRQATQH